VTETLRSFCRACRWPCTRRGRPSPCRGASGRR